MAGRNREPFFLYRNQYIIFSVPRIHGDEPV